MTGGTFLSNVKKGTWFHRLDARVKFAYLLTILVVDLMFLDPKYLTYVLISTIPFWIIARIDIKAILPELIGAGLMLFSFMLFMFSFSGVAPGGQAGAAAFHLGPLTFYLSAASVGLVQILRLAVPLLTCLLVFATTDPTLFGKAMMQMKIPGEISFILVTAFNLFPMALQAASEISDAQRIRGVSLKGFSNRMKATGLLLLPLFVNTLRKSRERGIAVECRGFGARKWKESLATVPLQTRDYVMIAWIALLIVAALYVRFVRGLGWQWIV